jgi:hypothetical protein
MLIKINLQKTKLVQLKRNRKSYIQSYTRASIRKTRKHAFEEKIER